MRRANIWLNAAVSILRDEHLIRPGCPEFEVSLGFGLSGHRALGECFPPSWNADKCLVFISPVARSHVDRLATIIHESIHVELMHEGGRGLIIHGGHGRRFITRAEEVGLTMLNKKGSTGISRELNGRLDAAVGVMYDHVGAPQFPDLYIPHSYGRGSAARTDARHLSCVVCGYRVRISRKAQRLGIPACPNKRCPYVGVTLGENPRGAIDRGDGTVEIPHGSSTIEGTIVVRL